MSVNVIVWQLSFDALWTGGHGHGSVSMDNVYAMSSCQWMDFRVHWMCVGSLVADMAHFGPDLPDTLPLGNTVAVSRKCV